MYVVALLTPLPQTKDNLTQEFVGTLRTPSCRYVAGEFSDICDQCRLLQEPLEFLGL